MSGLTRATAALSSLRSGGGVHPHNNYDQHQTGVTWWYNHAHIIPGGVLYLYLQGTSASILWERSYTALLVFCFLTLRCVMSAALIPHNGSVLSQFFCLAFSKGPPITGLSVSRAPFTRYLRKLMIDSHQFERPCYSSQWLHKSSLFTTISDQMLLLQQEFRIIKLQPDVNFHRIRICIPLIETHKRCINTEWVVS